jgi:hypothetical protein
MVYQEGGKNFRISAQTDLPFLQLSTLQAQLRDRYELRATMIPEAEGWNCEWRDCNRDE